MCDLTNREKAEALGKLLETAHASENEEQLKIGAEGILKQLCERRDVFWNSYTYERSLLSGKRRVDAVHGSTIIEYEPPRSFHGVVNAQLKHARAQAEEYAGLLASEEGRPVEEYTLIAWDGETISFGCHSSRGFAWEPARPFDALCLDRLLDLIADGGRPLVSPMLLKQFIGPNTKVGQELLPALFSAIVRAKRADAASRTKLIYTEWARLFGQVDGTETERLSRYLEESSTQHGSGTRKTPRHMSSR